VSITLADIENLPDDNEVKLALFRSGLGPYENFCEQVENSIVQAMHKLEKSKPQFKGLSEDALTAIIAFGLDMLGFNVDHDNYRNGHCDLVIKQGLFEWYGEAKLDSGPGYVMEGFRQLCDRYSPGGPTANRGGLIVYTKKRNKKRILEVWLKRIVKDYERTVTITQVCPVTQTGKTEHEHPASGLTFHVRHFPISFYHSPTDKSARARKRKSNTASS